MFFCSNDISNFNEITFNPLSVNSLECVSMNNQKCKISSEILLILMSLCFIPIVLQ